MNAILVKYFIEVFYDKSIGFHRLAIPRTDKEEESICIRIDSDEVDSSILGHDNSFTLYITNCEYGKSNNKGQLELTRNPRAFTPLSDYTTIDCIIWSAHDTDHPEILKFEEAGIGIPLHRITDLYLKFPTECSHMICIHKMVVPI